ncbi:MAG: hypothetical protein NVSMB49_11720 [Ktedonobacteraceae bacterium]
MATHPLTPGPIPLYHQLKQIVRSEIDHGVYRSGDRLPEEVIRNRSPPARKYSSYCLRYHPTPTSFWDAALSRDVSTGNDLPYPGEPL